MRFFSKLTAVLVLCVLLWPSLAGAAADERAGQLEDPAAVADGLMSLFYAALRNESMFEKQSEWRKWHGGIRRMVNVSPLLEAAQTFTQAAERFPVHPEIIRVIEAQLDASGTA
jgi:hypothetical protein